MSLDTKNISGNKRKVPLELQRRSDPVRLGWSGSGRCCRTVRGSKTSSKCISNRRRSAETGGPRQHVCPSCGALWPACGGAAPRCSGRRARCGGVPTTRADEEGREKAERIPELPDGRLASNTADSCFPLIYLQQEETERRGGERERVRVLSRRREERHLLSAPLLSAAPHSSGTSARSAAGLQPCVCAGVCERV